MLHATLAAAHPTLAALIVDATPENATAPLVDVLPPASAASLPDSSVHWLRNRSGPPGGASSSSAVADRCHAVCLVWDASEALRLHAAGALGSRLVAAQAMCRAWHPECVPSLLFVGKNTPGLDRLVAELQLDAGVSARRAVTVRDLADLLHAHGRALARAEKKAAKDVDGQGQPDFLAGLTSADILHNKGVPKTLTMAWLGALKQLLPSSAADAVHAAFPSFRKLYTHLRANEAAGRPLEGHLADLRVAGGKRLGPARSRRLARLLLAGREEAFEVWQ